MFNPFSLAKNVAGYGLLGGLMDNKPGAFSHVPGGLKGLLSAGGPSAAQPGGPSIAMTSAPAGPVAFDEMAPPTGPMGGVGAATQRPTKPGATPIPQQPAQSVPQPGAVQRPQVEPGKISFLRTLTDVLYNGENPFASMDRQRRMPEYEAAQQRYRDAIEGMNLTPEQKVWLAMDPEGFMKARNKPKEYQYFEVDGDQYRFDPTVPGAKPELIFDYTNPNADLERQEIEARIAANQALVGQREASSRLSGVRADAGGYAPRSGGGTSRSAPARPSGAGAVQVSTPQQLAALPSGALFVGPDGKTRRKP